MRFEAYVSILRRIWWIIALGALLGVSAGFLATKFATPIYASTVTFYVSTPTEAAGGNAFQANQYAVSKVQSYTQLASSERLAAMIVTRAGLGMTPSEVARSISASFDLNTVLLTASVQNPSRERAQQIATALSTEFGRLIDQLDNRASKDGTGRPTVVLNVVSGPTLEAAPISPRGLLNLAVGFAAGIALGALLGVVRATADTTVRSPEALESSTGVPVLGTFSFDKALVGRERSGRRLPLKDMLTSVKPGALKQRRAERARAEAVRQLRTNLMFLGVDHPLKVIVVTSAFPHEGKSSVASSLASAFAESGARTLLIEADLRRPELAGYLGLEGGVGLSNVLAGQVHLDDVVQIWGEHDLRVLTAGAVPPNPAELLGGDRMTKLLHEARESFEIVIVDTPPVLPVVDAALLAAKTDGSVLVARHGHTKSRAAAAAVEALRRVDASVVGAVLNGIPVTRAESPSAGYASYY